MNHAESADYSQRPLRLFAHIALIALMAAGGFTFILPSPNVQANQAEFEESLARINTYRAWIGIEPLRMHPSLMDAAQSHADYWLRNSGHMPGLHNQTPGAPGFTGATMSDRAANFGYHGSINENVGLSGSMVATVDWSIATINHRLTLIDPRYTHIGFGAVKSGNGGMETIMLGTQNWSNTAEPAWQAWPVNGTTNIGLTYLGSAPSPFSNVPYPVGYPITLKYHGGGSVQFHSASLRANGAEVPILSGVGDGWLSRNTMMILATDPLQPNTNYDVTVRATANGESLTHSWSFQTGASNSARPQHSSGSAAPPATGSPDEDVIVTPAGLESANPAFRNTWAEADLPVSQGNIERSWLWGPDAFAKQVEPYSDSPEGEREVAYLDKSRMEINDPNADLTSQWYVTNGLLVRDMIRGVIQTGDNEFIPHEGPQLPVAGDRTGPDTLAPTYAQLRPYSSVIPGNQEPDRTGEEVKTWITRNGTKYHGPEPPGGVYYGRYDEVSGYNVADVFWNWISSADHYDWLYAVGHPITDPHWVYAPINGEPQWILIQAFQRRILTYTPVNAPDWQLEMGNVGRHYYEWRYDVEAP